MKALDLEAVKAFVLTAELQVSPVRRRPWVARSRQSA